MSAFWEKYRDPRWQRRRLEVMQEAEFACVECGATEKTLNVHHKLYRKGADPWDYQDHELECLCGDCHERVHKSREQISALLATGSSYTLELVIGYLKGLKLREYQVDQIPVNNAGEVDGVADAFGLSDQLVFFLLDEKNVVTSKRLCEERDTYIKQLIAAGLHGKGFIG